MDLLKMITEQVSNPSTLGKLGKTVGMEPSQVKQITELGLPTLLQALGQNSSSSDGASALSAALDQHQDDKVDDVDGFLDNVNREDGSKMLQHIFAGNSDIVQSSIAKKTGADTSQVAGIMTQLAPLLMGSLAQQKKQKNLDSSGVAGLLSGLTGQGGDSGIMGMVTNLLDADNDGSIVDEVGGLLKGIMKK
jgi:hypothetical protein